MLFVFSILFYSSLIMNHLTTSHFRRILYVLSTGLCCRLCVWVILCSTSLLLEWVCDKYDFCSTDRYFCVSESVWVWITDMLPCFEVLKVVGSSLETTADSIKSVWCACYTESLFHLTSFVFLSILPCLWAVGWVSYVSMIRKLTDRKSVV